MSRSLIAKGLRELTRIQNSFLEGINSTRRLENQAQTGRNRTQTRTQTRTRTGRNQAQTGGNQAQTGRNQVQTGGNQVQTEEDQAQGDQPQTENQIQTEENQAQAVANQVRNEEYLTEVEEIQNMINERPDKIKVFQRLIINIRWHESREGGYKLKALETWKRAHASWNLIDETLPFYSLGKVIRRFLSENKVDGIDLTRCEMKNIPEFWNDMNAESDDDDDEPEATNSNKSTKVEPSTSQHIQNIIPNSNDEPDLTDNQSTGEENRESDEVSSSENEEPSNTYSPSQTYFEQANSVSEEPSNQSTVQTSRVNSQSQTSRPRFEQTISGSEVHFEPELQSTQLERSKTRKAEVNTPANQSTVIDYNEAALVKFAQALQLSNSVTPSINTLSTARDDVREWFNHFDLITRSCGWSDETKGAKLPVYLKKDALHIWQRMNADSRYNYEEVKNRLIKELFNEDVKNQARVDFFAAAQTSSERPEDFGLRIKKIAKRTDLALKEEDIVERYISGLNPEIRLAVIGKEPKTLNEAIRFSSKIERYSKNSPKQYEIQSVTRFDNSSNSKNTIPNISNKPSVKCYYCAENGHVKNDCGIREKALQLLDCRKCGKSGHYASKCPVRPVKSNAPAPVDQGRCSQ